MGRKVIARASGDGRRTPARPARPTALALLALLVLASPARAFEALDGRVQAHGFFESQLRALNADFAEDWDVAQWYNVFNLELEFDILDDQIGPFDLISAYVRLEGRYDCVYSNGCGMFRSINAFGNDSKSLPRRLSNAESATRSFEVFVENDGRLSEGTTDPVPLDLVSGFTVIADTDPQQFQPFTFNDVRTSAGFQRSGFRNLDCDPSLGGFLPCMVDSKGLLGRADGQPDRAESRFFRGVLDPAAPTPIPTAGPGSTPNQRAQFLAPDGTRIFQEIATVCDESVSESCATGITPFEYVLGRFADYRFTQIQGRGGSGGGMPVTILGPWLPDNEIQGTASLAGIVNPFDQSRGSPVLFTGAEDKFYRRGGGARPFRPIPVFDEDQPDMVYDPETGVVTFEGALFEDGVQQPPLERLRRANAAARAELESVLAANEAALQSGQISQAQKDELDVAAQARADRALARAANQAAERIDPRLIDLDGVFDPADQTRDPQNARGLYLPSKPFREAIAGDLESIDEFFNIGETERAFNRGLSQNDEGELKEAYFDIEMFDSRLWLRIGKQNIVWGKTELFRTTDQFNPQDLALASLPSLEESRIALWAFRSVYSFYEVGPLEDFRVELAFNFDEFESNDLGACGEAFTVNLVCAATFGTFAHGFTGIGVAGAEVPDAPWESLRGWEVGGRVEFRWDRFSFAFTDFYGYNDLPAVKRISTFSRNVDPVTGRPRAYGYYGDGSASGNPCRTQDGAFQLRTGLSSYEIGRAVDPACLRPGPTIREEGIAFGAVSGYPFGPSNKGPAGAPNLAIVDLNVAQNINSFRIGNNEILAADDLSEINANLSGPYRNALDNHHANLQFFTFICATTVGIVPSLDPASCAQSVFGSTELASAGLSVGRVIGRLLGGDFFLNASLQIDTTGASGDGSFLPFSLPLVALSYDISPQRCDRRLNFFGLATGDYENCAFVAQRDSTPGPDRDENGRLIFAYVENNLLEQQIQGPGAAFHDPVVRDDVSNFGCADYDVTLNGVVVNRVDIRGCGSFGTLSKLLTAEQEALLGCGPFWGTNCDVSGIDLLNAEASALLQAFTGASGTNDSVRIKRQVEDANVAAFQAANAGRLPTDEEYLAFAGIPRLKDRDGYRTDEGLQPGTLEWELSGIGGPTCTTGDIGGQGDQILPGCRRKWNDLEQTRLNLFGEDLEAYDQAIAALGLAQANTLFFSGTPADPTDPNSQTFGRRDSRSWDISKDGDPDPGFINNVTPPGAETQIVFPRRDGAGNVGCGVLPGTFTAVPCRGAVPVNLDFRPNTEANKFFGGGHPFKRIDPTGTDPVFGNAGVPFASEIAIVSFNFLMLATAFSEEFQDGLDAVGDYVDPGFHGPNSGRPEGERCTRQFPCDPVARRKAEFEFAYTGTYDEQADPQPGVVRLSEVPLIEEGELIEGEVFGPDHCSFITPQHCGLVQGLNALAGVKRNVVRAGGNGRFGRRTFQWHSGGEIGLVFEKRNVLGFSMDFAEDYTKSNWGIEFTYIGDQPNGDADAFDGITRTDDFNLTIALDRPTFINFLNPNRTFFITTQWFLQYRAGFENSFSGNGPFNALGIVAIQTGYFQDRLLPNITLVYDTQSISGAGLTQVTYRFNDAFSATFGVNAFFGRISLNEMPINEVGPASNRQGQHAYSDGVENGLSLVRDRDEVFFRLRYTF